MSECEKRSGRVAMDPRRPRGFFHRSIISPLSLSPPRILSSASGKHTRGREEEIGWKTKVVETPREGEIAAKETQERAIYGAA